MADDLKERTARLLTDYLECCAREPGTPEPQPSTPEAAVLRSAAAQLQRIHRPFFSAYRGYPGNRVELMMRVVEAVLPDGHDLSWGRVVTLVTFAGTLLERGPHLTTTRWQRRNEIARDCQRLVTLLCTRLTGQYRAWLQAQGGWVSTMRPSGPNAGDPGGALEASPGWNWAVPPAGPSPAPSGQIS